MRSKLLFPAFITMALSLSACSTTVDPVREMALWGDPAPVTAATRTVVIGPATRYVNAEGGETVKFVSNGQEFAWTFYPETDVYFELNKVAPRGMLDHRVMASSLPPERYWPNF
jgi:hypothetical protein